MANFTQFIPKLLKHEGGYVNLAADRGGETYRGITRKNFSKWSGWSFIDKQSKPIKRNTVFPVLENQVASFYKLNFWDKIKGDLIKSQDVAELYADFFINSGGIAHRRMNESLKELGAKSINQADGARLHQLLWQKRKQLFEALAKKPNQAGFLKGWMNRLNSFASNLGPETKAIAVGGAGTLLLAVGLFFLITKSKKSK